MRILNLHLIDFVEDIFSLVKTTKQTSTGQLT
jgi:hypothetical protein